LKRLRLVEHLWRKLARSVLQGKSVEAEVVAIRIAKSATPMNPVDAADEMIAVQAKRVLSAMRFRKRAVKRLAIRQNEWLQRATKKSGTNSIAGFGTKTVAHVPDVRVMKLRKSMTSNLNQLLLNPKLLVTMVKRAMLVPKVDVVAVVAADVDAVAAAVDSKKHQIQVMRTLVIRPLETMSTKI